jgi:ParB family chromosome partitioning protein
LISAAPVAVTPTGEYREEPALSAGRGRKSAADLSEDIAGKAVRYIAIEQVINNPNQPRQDFPPAELKELADSIKNLGVLQPVLVRRPQSHPEGKYEIIAGERRWRAAQSAGLSQLPVIITEATPQMLLEMALVENIQRQNLNPIEEAEAYKRLADEFSLSQKEIADRVGKERASVANYIRLLTLPESVIKLIRGNALSMGHAKALLSIKDPAALTRLAKKVVSENLSVRATEAIAARVGVLDEGNIAPRRLNGRRQEEPQHYPEVADRIRKALGTKVLIRHNSHKGRGRIEIEYFSTEELERLMEHICG